MEIPLLSPFCTPAVFNDKGTITRRDIGEVIPAVIVIPTDNSYSMISRGRTIKIICSCCNIFDFVVSNIFEIGMIIQ